MDVRSLAEQYHNYAVEIRRALHRRPEISNQEFETTAYLTKKLRELGIPCEHPTKTGVIGIIRGTGDAKTVGLRADIDALPLQEETGLPYASEIEGAMHACGHDAHTAALMTAARILWENRDRFDGTVKLFFQPAEEKNPSGAQGFIDAGAVAGLDAMMGLHVAGELPVGSVSVEPGVRMATAARVKIRVFGKGGHGARPHLGVDALVAASAIVMNLQSIASRELPMLDSAVISIGRFQAGTGHNILAQEAELEGTIKFFNPELNAVLEESITRIAKQTALAYRATAEVEYISRGKETSPLINDERLSLLSKDAVCSLYGPEALTPLEKSTGSEDFSRYGKFVPLHYAFIGTRNDEKFENYPAHHPKFQIDEDALTIAGALYVRFALDFLAK